MGIRTQAEDAGWSLRETVWDVEERLLWRGSDATRSAASRALRSTEPLQRLVQTKLAWPVSDAVRNGGTAARGAIATAAVVAVAGAGAAGVTLVNGGEQAGAGQALVSTPVPGTSSVQTLSGPPIDFEKTSSTSTAAASTKVAAQAGPPGGASAPDPAAPPVNVAWDFAQAFVAYEVGNADEQTAATFAQVADAPLADALGADPPRLPADQKVPEAKVLNVVVGERDGPELEVSVSLVRLEAASELRITLRHTPEGWRVARVLG